MAWEKVTVDRSWPYTITGAPRAANGLVYIGNSGAEYGVRGYVSAYDAATSDLRWRFYTVPGEPGKGVDGAASDSIMASAAETWTGEWWKLGGGGTVWNAIVYDPEFDQLIIDVGNGSLLAGWRRQLVSLLHCCIGREDWRLSLPKNGFFYVLDRENGRLISAAPLFPMFPTKVNAAWPGT